MHLKLDLRTEPHAQVVMGLAGPVDEVANIKPEPDRTDIEFRSSAWIQGGVRAAVAKIAQRGRQPVYDGSIRNAKPHETTLECAKDPGVLSSDDDFGTDEAVQQRER